jgi:hypothetical protein
MMDVEVDLQVRSLIQFQVKPLKVDVIVFGHVVLETMNVVPG